MDSNHSMMTDDGLNDLGGLGRRTDICCKYHPEAILIEDHRAGDEICSQCGLVVQDRAIDVSVNWRTFDDDNASMKDGGGGHNSCRVGYCNPLLNGTDLGTFIEPFSSSSSSSSSCRQRSNDHFRPSKCFTYENKYYEDLKGSFVNISRIGEHLLLSITTIFKAQQIFKEITEKDMSRSFYKEEVFAACVYIACRQDKVPRTFKEVCAASNSGTCFTIGAHFKNIVNLLELTTETIFPQDFVPRFCAKLALPYEVEKIASRIVIDVNYTDIFEGCCHVTGVGAAILIAAQRTEKHKRSLKQVAHICGVSEVSITKARDTLYPFALKTLTKWFPAYGPPVPKPLKNYDPKLSTSSVSSSPLELERLTTTKSEPTFDDFLPSPVSTPSSLICAGTTTTTMSHIKRKLCPTLKLVSAAPLVKTPRLQQ